MRVFGKDTRKMATFELWNAESGNLLGTFATEPEALAAVHEAVQRNGLSYGRLLSLGREGSRGSSRILASGQQLVERAASSHEQVIDHRLPDTSADGRRRRPG
jgi:hypothetical protein